MGQAKSLLTTARGRAGGVGNLSLTQTSHLCILSGISVPIICWHSVLLSLKHHLVLSSKWYLAPFVFCLLAVNEIVNYDDSWQHSVPCWAEWLHVTELWCWLVSSSFWAFTPIFKNLFQKPHIFHNYYYMEHRIFLPEYNSWRILCVNRLLTKLFSSCGSCPYTWNQIF